MSFKTWLREKLGYRACMECGNLFERAGDKYGDSLCPTHRSAQRTKDYKRDMVMEYVNAHMDELEDKAREWRKKVTEASYDWQRAAAQQQSALSQAARSQGNLRGMWGAL